MGLWTGEVRGTERTLTWTHWGDGALRSAETQEVDNVMEHAGGGEQ